MKKTFTLIAYLFFLFFLVEVALRLQQKWGPYEDMEFLKFDERNISYDLNHKPNLTEKYNADGIQTSHSRPVSFGAGVQPFKVLFMGDSFMQGFSPDQAIPQYVWEEFQKTDLKDQPLLFWNAGYSSYAPLLYIVQAQKLIPKYQPDLVVIDIDESDLVDDYALYHPFTVRDAEGKLLGVRPSPPYEFRTRGFAALRQQPFYAVRLLGMWIHKIRLSFMYNAYHQKYKAKYMENPMSDKNGKFSFNLVPLFDNTPGAEERYRPEMESFRKDLRELAATLKQLLGDSQKVLFLYHPHLYQLQPDPRGFLWRQYVPKLLRELEKETQIEFFDATEDLRKDFGERPDLYYREWDMHFYPKGLQVYSRRIAERMLSKINQITQMAN